MDTATNETSAQPVFCSPRSPRLAFRAPISTIVCVNCASTSSAMVMTSGKSKRSLYPQFRHKRHGRRLSSILCLTRANQPCAIPPLRRRSTAATLFSRPGSRFASKHLFADEFGEFPSLEWFHDDFACVQKDGGHGALHFGVARRGASLMLGLQDRVLVPVIGRHRNAPDVSWLIKFDPAVQRVRGIDIDNPSRSASIRQISDNRDFHSNT